MECYAEFTITFAFETGKMNDHTSLLRGDVWERAGTLPIKSGNVLLY